MPLVRGLEQPGLGPARIGEGAPLVAEQLGLEQRLGDRRAVDVDEGAARARARAMDHAGDEALAGAGLALEQDRRGPPAALLPAEKPANGLPDTLDGRALAQQLVDVRHGPANIAQVRLLVKLVIRFSPVTWSSEASESITY